MFVSKGVFTSAVSLSLLLGSLLAGTAPVCLAASLPGFDCEPASETLGSACIGTIPEYPNPVAIVIPPHYQAPDGAPELTFFFHGDNASSYTIGFYLKRFLLREAAASSGKLLIFPHSWGRVDDQYVSHLQDAAHFEKFVRAMATLLNASGLTRSADFKTLTLSGHSGAWRTISAILANRNFPDRVRNVYLLDSTYGAADVFAAFARDPAHRLWSVFSDDSGTSTVSSCIMTQLEDAEPGQPAVPYFGCRPYGLACTDHPVADASCRPPLDGKVTAADIRANRVGFFRSEEDHYDIPMKYLPAFLAP